MLKRKLCLARGQLSPYHKRVVIETDFELVFLLDWIAAFKGVLLLALSCCSTRKLIGDRKDETSNMELRISKLFGVSLLLTLLFLGNTSCKPSQQDIQYSQQINQVIQSRQFIGSSVIGGLMWPILLTLAVTATMARVPDILQRLLTGLAGGGGGGGYKSYRSKRSKIPEVQIDEILRLLEQSFTKLEQALAQDLTYIKHPRT